MPLPATVNRLDREPSREIIYRQLKGLILDLTLRPLEVLRDADLARQLGVSRTPVREALRKLEDEGLVESQRNQWTRVSGIVPRHLLELYPVAQALHVTALRLAFKRLAKEDLQAMRDANAALSDAIARGRPAQALRADAAFHGVIVERAGNPVLRQLVGWLTERLQRQVENQALQAPIDDLPRGLAVEAIQGGGQGHGECALTSMYCVVYYV